MKNTFLLSCCFFVVMFSIECKAIDINPYPRQLIKKELVKTNIKHWKNNNNCIVKSDKGKLEVEMTGSDPSIKLENISSDKPLKISFRAKSTAKGSGQFFWKTDESDFEEQEKAVTFNMVRNGKWHDYSVILPVIGHINSLRFDTANDKGTIEIDCLKAEALTFHPLEIIKVTSENNFISAIVTNHSNSTLTFNFNNKKFQINSKKALEIKKNVNSKNPFESVFLKLEFPNFINIPTLVRPVNVVNWNAKTDWITIKNKNLKVQVSRDGKGAKIFYKNYLAAVIYPLASCESKTLELNIKNSTANQINLVSKKDASKVFIKLNKNNIEFSLSADKNVKGPTLRIRDSIEQGLLAGVEYLGKNEKSSSKLDLKVKEHLRFKPDKMLLTMPLMAFVTPEFSVAFKWKNMNLQPYFAVPDFFNGTDGGMMALEGENIKTIINFSDGWNSGNIIENIIEWSVKLSGFPKLPKPPRTEKEQLELCLKGINSVHNENGWGHCADDHFQKLFHADYVSLIWRATGKIEETPDLILGGGHLSSPEAFFITGRAEQWLKIKKEQAKNIIKSQKKDGSFRYNGKFREGHFEDTASGYCAIYAQQLLRIAYYTGNKKALAAGLKTLDYMSRFRTPRGSQTWEIPLHTPDILASGRITKSYILAYKLTGNKKYLKEARKWAISGIPFVYLWGNQPIMEYATIAVLGATGWTAPNWIGLPVQWCGLVYADAILDLAKYDKTINWEKLAKGIFICGEQMQYFDGKTIGTLPDSFTLKTQTRNIYDIGPLMLMQFQRIFADKPTGIYVASNEKNIITSPFPVKIKHGEAIINAKKGMKYQVIINQKVRNIKSEGEDIIKF